MKKIIALLLALVMVLSFAACGKDESKSDSSAQSGAESTFVGEWIGVGGAAWDVSLTAEDAAAYALSVSDDGKATISIDGDPIEAEWSSKGDKITLKADALAMSTEGTLKDGAILFEDLFDLGIKIYFAQEGTDAADPSLYIPESDKAMVGTWTSYAVTDLFDDDISDVVPADSLIMIFNGDYTVDISLGDETIVGETWTISDGFGFLLDSEYDFTWDVVDDEIVVSYYDESDTYKFTCAKN